MYPYLKRGIILFFAIFVLGTATLYWKGASLVRTMAKESLEKTLSPIGIHEVEVDRLSFGWGRIYLRDIHSKESSSKSSLSIQELDIAFSPFFGVKAVDVIGASLDLLEGGDQSSFSLEDYREKLASIGEKITHFKTVTLPQISIRESSFIVPTHKGPLNLPLQMTTQTTVMRHQIMTLDFGEQGEVNFSGQIVLDFGQEDVTLDIHTTNIDIETPHFQLTAPEISLLCHLVKEEADGGQIEGFARINQLKLRHYGMLLTPLEINLQAEGTPEKFVLDELTITEKTAFPQKGVDVPALFEIEGSFEPERPYAQATVAFQIPRLAKFWDFTPLIAKKGEKIEIGGNITGEGELIFDKGRITTQAFNIRIQDASLIQDSFSLEGASSHFILKGLTPIATKGLQHVSVKQASLVGVALKDVRFAFLFDDRGDLKIDYFTAATLGGSLKANRFRKITPAAFQFEANFKSIELAEILKLTDLSTLSGQAKLRGNALMQYSPEGGIDVVQAQLDSVSESGVIQYKPEKGNSGKSFVSQSEIEMAYNVLDNFHFTLFNIRLIHIPNNPGEMQGIIKILGSNPNVLNGYPFEFNIVTTGKLKDLVVNTLKNMNSPPDFQNKPAKKQDKP